MGKTHTGVVKMKRDQSLEKAHSQAVTMKNSSYDLTIIIPHFNMPQELGRLLDSIGCRDEVQIIVADDHSDQFLDELAVCKEIYRHVLFLETDRGKKGAGPARNTALRHAKGKWLLFADSDDLFLPGWFDLLSPYMDTRYDLICFSPTSKKRDGTASKRHERYERLVKNYLSSTYGGEERLRGHFSGPWSKLIRRSLIERNHIKFDEVFYSADVMFSAKVGYYAGKITAVNTPFYCIIEHEGSMSQNKSGEVFCGRLRIACKRELFFRKRFTKKQFNAYRRMCLLSCAKDALKKGYDWQTIATMQKIFRENHIPFVIINYRKRIDRLRAFSKRIIRSKV